MFVSLMNVLLPCFLLISVFGLTACQSTTTNHKNQKDVSKPLVEGYKTFKSDIVTIHYPPEEKELAYAINEKIFSLPFFLNPEDEDHFQKEARDWKDKDVITIAEYLALKEPSKTLIEVRDQFIGMFEVMFGLTGGIRTIDIFHIEDLIELAKQDVFIQGITVDEENRTLHFEYTTTSTEQNKFRGIPIFIKKEDEKSLEEKIESFDEMYNMLSGSNGMFRGMYFFVLHEATEAEIISNIIRSSDRRWFCDGMANMISLLTLRTHDENRELTLDDLLEKFYPCPGELLGKLPEMNLELWLAVENENKGDGSMFGDPYYYLATVVMLEIIKENGEDWIAELFKRLREQGIDRSNMLIVYSLFKEITGTEMLSYIPQAKLWIVQNQKNREGQTAFTQKLAEAVECELKNENTEAITVLNKLLSLEEEDAEEKQRAKIFFRLARIYTKEGKYEEALTYYNQGIELNNSAATAWCDKGLLLDSMGRSDEAKTCFEKVIELNPKYTEHIVNQAKLFLERNDWKSAMKYCDKGLRINPKSANGWIIKSVIHVNGTKDLQAASVCLDKALAIDPKNALAWYNKGIISVLGNDIEGSLGFFDQAIICKADYTDAWHLKAQVLTFLKQNEEALLCFDKVIELNSEHVDAWRRKAKLLTQMGRPEEALFFYDKIIEINAEDADALESKRNLLKEIERHKDAA